MRSWADGFYADVARIIREYGVNGDRALLHRRLQMLRVNYGELTRRQRALIQDLKKRI